MTWCTDRVRVKSGACSCTSCFFFFVRFLLLLCDGLFDGGGVVLMAVVEGTPVVFVFVVFGTMYLPWLRKIGFEIRSFMVNDMAFCLVRPLSGLPLSPQKKAAELGRMTFKCLVDDLYCVGIEVCGRGLLSRCSVPYAEM
jgi:hypothetical protein